MKVIKVDSSNDQGADFQPINLEKVFQELKASVKGKDYDGRDKKDKVKEYESLKIIGDSDDSDANLQIEEEVHDEVTNDEEDEPKTCKKGCCLLQ